MIKRKGLFDLKWFIVIWVLMNCMLRVIFKINYTSIKFWIIQLIVVVGSMVYVCIKDKWIDDIKQIKYENVYGEDITKKVWSGKLKVIIAFLLYIASVFLYPYCIHFLESQFK